MQVIVTYERTGQSQKVELREGDTYQDVVARAAGQIGLPWFWTSRTFALQNDRDVQWNGTVPVAVPIVVRNRA